MLKGNKGHTSALYVWNGLLVFWGTSFHTNPHHHDTLQLVFDVDKEFKLRDRNGDWKSYSAAIIDAGHTHQLDSNNSIQLIMYLDKKSEYAIKLQEKYLDRHKISDLHNSDLRKLSTDFFKRLLVMQDCKELLNGCMNILTHLIQIEKPAPIDLRIEKAISFIVDAPLKQFKVKDVADHISLSESRLRHLFKEQVGQPIQNFIMWMKVVDSLNLVLKGKKLGITAQEAGFWDASHMNRSYKELLGVAPSTIKQYEDELKVIACSPSHFHSLKTEILRNWDDETPFSTIQI